jgi:hypothetical protein
MNETVIREALEWLLSGDSEVGDTALAGCWFQSLRDAGFLTRDEGLQVNLPDGSEFCITIQQRH